MGKQSFYYGWWITITSSVGLSSSPGQFVFGAMSLFIIPLTVEFGADCADVNFALTVFTVALALTSPFIGNIADRFGAKETLIPSLLIFGVLLAAVGLLVTDLWHLYIIFALIGFPAAGANALPFMRIIGEWFNKKRGLALGIAMAGGGAGFAYVPPMLRWVIEEYSWRYGYYVLAAIVLFISLPLSALVLKNKPSDMGLNIDNEHATEDKSTHEAGETLTLKQITGQRTFWILYLIFILLSFCLYGLLANLVPMLGDRGMSTVDAANVAAVLGIAIILSRAVIGYFLDRYFAPNVAIISILLSTVGIGLLAYGVAGAPAYLAALLVGLSIGTEFDLLAYLTSRYFGLKSFGLVYGLMFSAFLIGSATGPLTYGASFDHFGSYINVLIGCVVILLVTVGLFKLLPDYQYKS